MNKKEIKHHYYYEGDFLKKVLLIIISIFIGVLVYRKNNEIIIPSDAIRIRIIANSNSINDMYEKKKLKEEIKNDLYKLVNTVNSSDEADKLIKSNINLINKLISSKTSDYKLEYGLNYFPKKVYKGVIYPEGNYNSIVITLGKGLGDNWWCVLYPPICLLEDNYNTSDVEYRLLIADMLRN